MDDDVVVGSQDTRRSIDELRDRLDTRRGDAGAKRSAFWIMLVLSAVIAAAGVATDSTATVIGAMIIAPLSTPIYGTAFGVVTRDARVTARSVHLVTVGALAVVGIGVVMVWISPSPDTVAASSQLLSRTSPTLGDLLAATATGFAGSFALIRRDLGDTLPGIAVAISLVPPLVVVGMCLGIGSGFQALGALILFLSNVAAMIAACTLLLTVSGFRTKSAGSVRAYLAVGAFFVAVAIPIAVNTATLVVQHTWGTTVRDAAEKWISGVPGAQIESTRWEGRTIVVTVLSPDSLPSVGELEDAVRQQPVPNGVELSVVHNMGARLE